MIEYIKLVICFAAGIYLSDRVYAGFSIILLISLLLVLTITAIFKHKFNIKIFVAVVAFTAGICLCTYASSDATHDLYDYTDKYVTLTGRISKLPASTSDKSQYTVDVKKLVHDGMEIEIEDKILLTSKNGLEYGETITFTGFVNQLDKRMNENGFDYARYFKCRGIFFKMYSEEVLIATEKLHDYSLYALGMRVKSFVGNIIDEHYVGDYNALLKAILTGNKKEFSDDYEVLLNETGTGRFLYPAFIHVMMFMSAVSFILGVFPRKVRNIITVFLLIIYASFNFQNAVFIKLCIMLSAFIIFETRYGFIYYFDVLGVTALIMGVINPLVYYDVGFVMSMISSVLIYYFYDALYAKLKFIEIKYVRRLATIGLLCTAGMIPVTAYFFNSVSIYSIFASFIMIPCVGMIVVLSPLYIGMLHFFDAAPVVEQAVHALLFIIKNIPVVLHKIPFGRIVLPKTDVLFLIIYVFCIVAAVKHVKKKKQHMYMVLFVAAALSVSAVIGEVSKLNDVEITFVNVGQGDGAFITAPYRFNVLIDGGGGTEYSDYNIGEKIYLEYLKAEGITEIDSAFVSHYHKDHVQGIIAAVENLKVRNLFLPDELPENEWRIALENAAVSRGTKIHYISEETLLTYNNGMKIRIIPPLPMTRFMEDENDTTYVYHIEYGEFSAVFTGDMSSFAEKNMIEQGKVYEADLLKVAHHGSRTSTSREWVEAVNPKYALISSGESNTYSHPHDQTLENLIGVEVYRTDYDGDVRFCAERDGSVKIDTFNRR